MISSVRSAFLFGLLFLSVSPASSGPDDSSRVVIRAVRSSEPILVDGYLNESIWSGAPIENFIQSEPVEGVPPTQETKVWVAFDDYSFYIAARLSDEQADSINLRLARRDEFSQTDKFTVYLDAYGDKQTGNYFTVTASGVQIDGVLYNDEWDDNDWDGVWESSTVIDGSGWSAEIRIPFSQLRFHSGESHAWGVNFRRDISRNQEQDYLAYRPRNGSGFVSRFAQLVGIQDIVPSAGIEVVPYLTTRARFAPAQPGNPFNDGSDLLPGAGFDLKTTIAGNLSVTATVNPDFGQVEVDPDVVNLSDFETFFPEKRPFFVEGSSIFRFGYGGANSNWSFNFSNPNLFYSRRIGRPPGGSVPTADFIDMPSGTHILGAGKINGKVTDDLTVGMIHAFTNREYARASLNDFRSRVEVEPYTYFGVMRAQQNFSDRRYGLGFLGTAVRRFFGDDRLSADMNTSAYVAGVDGWAFLDEEKLYVINGWAAGSIVSGSAPRITNLQRASSHYFQRPDASHVSVDSSSTTLSGYAFRLALNKQEGPISFNAAVGAVDPGFEANDAGYISRTDLVNGHIATGYRWSEPTEWYRSASVRGSIFSTIDYEGNLTWLGYWTNSNVELPSYWSLFGGAVYNPPSISNRRTRGGPLMTTPDGVETFFGFESDSRKDVTVEAGYFQYLGGGGVNREIEGFVQYRPSPGLSVSLGPGYSIARSDRQWVGAYDDPAATATYGRRYVFADFNQHTFSTTLRLNWVFTPNVSLQLYTQTLFSSGKYTNIKSLTRARSSDFIVYGTGGSTLLPDDQQDPKVYSLDADGSGPSAAYAISNPDFNRTSIRGNAVLRWEYAPGSTFYIVWTQSRWDNQQNGEFAFRRSLNRLALAPAENIFMLKFSYWWNS